MSKKYILKAGVFYVAGKKNYSAERGYMDKDHPENTIELTKFNYKAKQFNTKEEAEAYVKGTKLHYDVYSIQTTERERKKPEYWFTAEAFTDVFKQMLEDRGEDTVLTVLNIKEATLKDLENGLVDGVGFQQVARIIKIMQALGYKGLNMYLATRTAKHHSRKLG